MNTSIQKQTCPRYDYELFAASDNLHSIRPSNSFTAIQNTDDVMNFPEEFPISIAQLLTIAKIGILMNHRHLGLDRLAIISTLLSFPSLSAILPPIRQAIQSFRNKSDIIVSIDKCCHLSSVWTCITIPLANMANFALVNPMLTTGALIVALAGAVVVKHIRPSLRPT